MTRNCLLLASLLLPLVLSVRSSFGFVARPRTQPLTREAPKTTNRLYRPDGFQSFDDPIPSIDWRGPALVGRGSSALIRRGPASIGPSPIPDPQWIVETINQVRQQQGLPPMILNPRLCNAAAQGSRILSRTGQIDYSQDDLKQRVQATGYDQDHVGEASKAGRSGKWDSYYSELYLPDWNGDLSILLEGEHSEKVLSTFEDIGISVQGNNVVMIVGSVVFTPFAPFTPQQQSEYASRVFQLTNEIRRSLNLPPFRSNRLLDMAAYHHAQDMQHRNFYSHRNPEGEEQHERIRKTGYLDFSETTPGFRSFTAENIAKGQQDPDQVVRDWMNSPSHKKNIVSTDVNELGVGVYGEYWVQNFGSIVPPRMPPRRQFQLPMRGRQPVLYRQF